MVFKENILQIIAVFEVSLAIPSESWRRGAHCTMIRILHNDKKTAIIILLSYDSVMIDKISN